MNDMFYVGFSRQSNEIEMNLDNTYPEYHNLVVSAYTRWISTHAVVEDMLVGFDSAQLSNIVVIEMYLEMT